MTRSRRTASALRMSASRTTGAPMTDEVSRALSLGDTGEAEHVFGIGLRRAGPADLHPGDLPPDRPAAADHRRASAGGSQRIGLRLAACRSPVPHEAGSSVP